MSAGSALWAVPRHVPPVFLKAYSAPAILDMASGAHQPLWKHLCPLERSDFSVLWRRPQAKRMLCPPDLLWFMWAEKVGMHGLSLYLEILLGIKLCSLSQRSFCDHSAFCCCTCAVFSGVTCFPCKDVYDTSRASALWGRVVVKRCHFCWCVHQMSRASVLYFQLQLSLSLSCLQLQQASLYKRYLCWLSNSKTFFLLSSEPFHSLLGEGEKQALLQRKDSFCCSSHSSSLGSALTPKFGVNN